MRWAAGPGQPVPPRPPPVRMQVPPPPKKGGGCLKIVLGLMVGSFLFCCCIVSAALESVDDPLNWEQVVQVPDVGPSNNLGVAVVPTGASAEQARRYAWRQRLTAFSLKYGVSAEVHQQVEDDFSDLSERFAYLPGKGTSFTWAPPPACRGREWNCVFDSLSHDNAENIQALTQLFAQRMKTEQLNQREVSELVISFVQNIKYRLPTEETAAFGLLPPTIVVADGSGDCDSKALLAVVILRQLGVDAVVLLGSSLGHAALGINVAAPGKKFGKKYSFVEVTTPGWAIGTIPPGYDIANAWKVIPVTVMKYSDSDSDSDESDD